MLQTSGLKRVNDIVKYYGRDVPLNHDDPIVVQTVKEINDLIENTLKSSTIRDNELWVGLRNDLKNCSNCLINPDLTRKKYRVELLLEAVVPYVKKMQSRLALDKERFLQLQSLLYLLSTDENSQVRIQQQHPSITLTEIDKIIAQINSKGSWFKSEL